MSWVRDYFYKFVFPAYIATGKDTREIGKPFDVKVSPHAPEKLPIELQKLWTLVNEHGHGGSWSYDLREGNAHGGSSKYRASAQLHDRILRNTLDSAVAAMRTEGCTKLFLGGRDVWAYAVLCERRGIPYLFVPELSRVVSCEPCVEEFLVERGFQGNELFLDTGFSGSIPRNLATHFGEKFKFRLMSQAEHFAYDEEIASLLKETDAVDHTINLEGPVTWHATSYKDGLTKLTSFAKKADRPRIARFPNQLFPNRRKARDEALETEYLAKYWRTGTVKPQPSDELTFNTVAELKSYIGKPATPAVQHQVAEGLKRLGPPRHIVQFFADRDSIQRAAMLTSSLWRGRVYAP